MPTVTNIGPCECCGGCSCGCSFTAPYPTLSLTLNATSTYLNPGPFTATIEVGDGNPCCYICNFGIVGGLNACEVTAQLCCSNIGAWVLTLTVSAPCGASQSHASELPVDCDLLDMDFTTYELYCPDQCGTTFYAGSATITKVVTPMLARHKLRDTKAGMVAKTKKCCGK